jgi:hypothetical protein
LMRRKSQIGERKIVLVFCVLRFAFAFAFTSPGPASWSLEVMERLRDEGLRVTDCAFFATAN